MPARLYLITPPCIALADFAVKLKDAFSGGDVACVQLRLKDAADRDILKAAETLIPLCRSHEAAFILNDRPDLAKTCGADGVHLGQDDLARWPIAKTRALLGEDTVVGVSCHDSPHLAMEAGDMGADYVAFGAFYPTKSKDPAKLAAYGTPKTDILQWWSTFTVLPCVAIGGMTPGNCASMARAGADFIAAITAVWEHPEGPAQAVSAFNSAMNRASAI